VIFLALFFGATDTYGQLVAVLHCLHVGKVTPMELTMTALSCPKLTDRIRQTRFSPSIIVIAV